VIPGLNTKTAWLLALAATAACVVAIRFIANAFAYEVSLTAAPVIEFTALMVAAGACWLGFVIITLNLESGANSRLLWVLIATGVVLRLLMFDTFPILETDHYRYLWDGAVVADGHNPYRFTPAEVLAAAGEREQPSAEIRASIQNLAISGNVPDALAQLGRASMPVLERVNQPQLNTIYPVIAEAAFATSAWFKAFSLDAWRAALLVSELCALALLLVALKQQGLSPLNAGIYWINPLVIKEVANTGHVDGLLSPLLIAVVIGIASNRRVIAWLCIALSAGIKLWPLMLTPFTPLRGADRYDRRLFFAGLFSVIVLAVLVMPMLLSSSDGSIGVVAYASEWRVNNPGFESLRFLIWIITRSEHTDLVARISVALIVGAVLLAAARNSLLSPAQLCDRMIVAITALLLLAPAVYPWYFLWIAALLALRPRLSLLILSVLLPIYYSRFYFEANGQRDWFTGMVMWVEFAPVFLLLAAELYTHRRLLLER